MNKVINITIKAALILILVFYIFLHFIYFK